MGPHRYFDTGAAGWEQLPDHQVLLVCNHSGGSTMVDLWGLAALWYAHFGTTRPLFVLGHELLFATEALARYFAQRGVLRASAATAERVLDAGYDLLIAPGGERDVWRPWKERWQVQFAGRTGYARLAARGGLPIVPVAGAGGHHTLVVLSDGHRLARILGLPNAARAEIWPLHLSLPWGLAFGPWPHLPVPRRLRYRFGPVIEGVDPALAGDEAAISALDRRVREGLQAELDALRRGWKGSGRGVRRTLKDMLF